MSRPIDRRLFLAGMGAVAFTAAPARAIVAAPTIRRLSPALDRVVPPGAMVETIASGIRWAEGPVWVPGTGLLFSDPPANLIRRWTRASGTQKFLFPSGAAGTDPALVREAGSNGLALGHRGTLLIANSGGRSIDRLDLSTRRRTVLTDRYHGQRFNSPNDLHRARDGSIYFTDPPYGLADGDASPIKQLAMNGVYRWRPDGGTVLIDAGLTKPNGIALSPDERRLYVSVSDEQAPRIMVYDLDRHGMPLRSRLWLDARPLRVTGAAGLPDGMKIARTGTMFCSVPGGMMILTPEAQPLGLIASDAPIANCAFGEGGSTLFMTGADRVFRLELMRGAGA